MRSKLKKCCECGQQKQIWATKKGLKYCRPCWNKVKPPKQPKSVSPKAKDAHKQYSSIRKLFLEVPKNSCCNGGVVPECTGCRPEYLTIHHKRGRAGKYYLDWRFFVTLCVVCHRYVEEHPKEARDLGLSEERI